MNYELVLAREQDYEFIYMVKKNAYIKYVEANWGEWNEEVQKELFDKFREKYKDCMYVIKVNNEKIGFYQEESLPNGDIEIGNICIMPQYQGRGLGTRIISDVLNKYKDLNIHIQYFKQNPVGDLYKRLGFELYKETNYHYQMIKKKD